MAHKQRIQGFGRVVLLLAILLVGNSGFAAEQITSESEPSSLQLLTDVNAAANFGKNAFAKNTFVVFKGDKEAVYKLTECPSNKLITDFLNKKTGSSESWLEKTCMAAVFGNIEDMFYIALMYRQGKNFSQNYTEALNWYQKAAHLGNTEAMIALAMIYDEGEIVTRNDAESVKWLRKAADANNIDAMVILGTRYFVGRGVNQSDTEAVSWWRQAADSGDVDAMENLAYAYQEGQGVAQSNTEAEKWLQSAEEAKQKETGLAP